MLNNCEHFCTECKINKPESQQVNILTDVLLGNLSIPLSEIICLAAKNSALALTKSVILRVAVFTVFIDVAISILDFYEVWEKYQHDKITFVQFQTSVRKKVFVICCTISLKIAGFFFGHILIPVPFVGGMVGGFLGHLSGLLLAVTATHIIPTIWNWMKGKFKLFLQRLQGLASKMKHLFCYISGKKRQ